MSTPPSIPIRALKVTAVLSPELVLALPALEGTSRTKFTITADSGPLTADIATKSLRKVQTAIREAGADKIAVILQGKLGRDEILEAGLIAQPRTPKPVAAAPPAQPPKQPAADSGLAKFQAAVAAAAKRDTP
jgi:hypothetical protein